MFAGISIKRPLENRLEELHSIVEFIDRHHLGPLFRFLNTHQVTDPSGKVTGYKNLHDLGKSLASMLIRRTKKEVLNELPKRIDKNYFVKLTPEQRRIHKSMFAGVLDGGENEVFMEGGRLARFMKTVESAASSIKPYIPEPSSEEEKDAPALEDKKTSREEAKEPLLEIKQLVASGISWLARLSEKLEAAEGLEKTLKENIGVTLRRNPETGKQSLEIPLPDEKTLTRFLQNVSELLNPQACLPARQKSGWPARQKSGWPVRQGFSGTSSPPRRKS